MHDVRAGASKAKPHPIPEAATRGYAGCSRPDRQELERGLSREGHLLLFQRTQVWFPAPASGSS